MSSLEDIIEAQTRLIHLSQIRGVVICNNRNCPRHGDHYSCEHGVEHIFTHECQGQCSEGQGECVIIKEEPKKKK